MERKVRCTCDIPSLAHRGSVPPLKFDQTRQTNELNVRFSFSVWYIFIYIFCISCYASIIRPEAPSPSLYTSHSLQEPISSHHCNLSSSRGCHPSLYYLVPHLIQYFTMLLILGKGNCSSNQRIHFVPTITPLVPLLCKSTINYIYLFYCNFITPEVPVPHCG